jgi:hypothetical protein
MGANDSNRDAVFMDGVVSGVIGKEVGRGNGMLFYLDYRRTEDMDSQYEYRVMMRGVGEEDSWDIVMDEGMVLDVGVDMVKKWNRMACAWFGEHLSEVTWSNIEAVKRVAGK